MQISCPQCATVYDLDERVLPPGGAPVQCTRCSRVFTAAPPAQRESGKTQIFGAPAFTASPPADPETREEPPPQKDRTQLYGKHDAAPVPAPAAPGRDAGTPPAPAPAAPARAERTQIFGAPPTDAMRSTQIFGAVKAPDPFAPTPAAAQFPLPPGGAGPSGAEGAPPARAERTQIFGAPPPDAMRSTQIFGAVQPPPARRPPEGLRETLSAPVPAVVSSRRPEEGAREPPAVPIPAAPAFEPRKTQVFGAPAVPAPVPAAPSPATSGPPPAVREPRTLPGAPEFDPRKRVSITAQTLRMPSFRPPGADLEDAPAAPARSRTSTPMYGSQAAAPEPAQPEPSRSSRRAGVATRPVAAFQPPSLALPDTDTDADSGATTAPDHGDDPGEALRRSRRRRTTIALGFVGLVALAIAGGAVFRELASRRAPPSEEAVIAHSEALRALRRDDRASLGLARQQLEGMTQRWPEYSEARVSHLVALLFELEDVKVQVERVTQQSAVLGREVGKLKERKEPADWENRVNALIDQLRELKAESDPLGDQLASIDGQVAQVYRALQTGPSALHPQDARQLVRAQAIYGGVKGSDQAIIYSERYRSLGGADGWGQVAFAEYALNARVAPETRRQARRELEALRATDSAWTRLYVMVGRLALKDNDAEGAVTALESALAINPEHATARLLLEQARALRAELAADR